MRGRAEPDDGWVALGRSRAWAPIVVASPLILVILVVNALNLSVVLVRELPLFWSVAIMVGVAAAAYFLALTVIRVLYPRAYVKASTSTVRAGGRRAHAADISSAQLLVSASKRRRTLNLLLQSDAGLRATVLIRDARQRTLEPSAAALVQDVIRRSTIAMPTTPNDPSGRFARYNFPNNITREEALELIAHPPAFGDPLPISPRI